MAVISCQVEKIEYTDIAMIVMIESKEALLTYRAFGDVLANTLNALARENSHNTKIKYREYSEKLNALMLVYMFIGVILPVTSFILIIAATTVMGSVIKSEILIILYLFFFPMMVVFMIIYQ